MNYNFILQVLNFLDPDICVYVLLESMVITVNIVSEI